MKKNDIKILKKDNIPLKMNLIKNIPFNKKNLNIKNIETPSKIKTVNISNTHNNIFDEVNSINNNNFFCTNNNFHKKKPKIKNEIKNISNYVSFNQSMLLAAYEESLSILFESLKLYMKNDLSTFNKIKLNFIKNVQNFYQRNKRKILSSTSSKKKNAIKNILSRHSRPNLNSQLNLMNFRDKINHTTHTITNKYIHKKNKSQSNKSMAKLISGLSNYSLNKSNISIRSPLNYTITNRNLDNNKNDKVITHRQSLYSLIRVNKPIISNSPAKNFTKQRYHFSILNNFINFNKNSFPISHGNVFENEEKDNDKNNYNNCCFNINSVDKNELSNYFTNINQNINHNIYYNNIISQMPSEKNNKTLNDEEIMNNEMISCIKNSLDDNLKGIFDFSYKSFLNKESERECN